MYLALLLILSAIFTLLYGIRFPRPSIPLLVGIFICLFIRSDFSIIVALLCTIVLFVFNIKVLNLILLSLAFPLLLILNYTSLPIIIISCVASIIFLLLSFTTENFSKILTILLSAFVISYELCTLYYLNLYIILFSFIALSSLSILLSKKELIKTQK